MRAIARFSGAALAALLLAGCQDPSGSKAGPPAKLDIVSGDNQTAPAGSELPDPLVVKVTDERGRPVRGQLVNFRVTSGGGTVFASSSITNADGIAQERWTLGTQAGTTQTVEARAIDTDTGQPIVFATFTATVTAGAPATITAAPAPGDTLRAGVAGSMANDSLRVLVKDAHGNPVPGAAVQWTATSGGGTVAPAPSAQTGADGIARAVWVLGGTADVTQKAQATVAGAGTVRYTARAATTLAKVSGDGQTAAVGTPITVSVRLTDSAGQPVGGIPVTWQVMSGGGSVAAGAPSGAEGVATVQWTLGPAAGTQVLNATAGTLNVSFTATAQRSAARTLVTQVPGEVMDVDATRVLWLHTTTSGTALKVRSRATGADQTILAENAASGKLFPGGVAGVTYAPFVPPTLHVYRDGTLSTLGGIDSQGVPWEQIYDVEGSWLAWRVSRQGPVLRRNLDTGAVDTVAAENLNTRRGGLDLAPNGYVAYDYGFGGQSGGTLVGTFWRPGGSDVFFNANAFATLRPRTDGINVIFDVYQMQSPYELRLAVPGGSVVLSTAIPGRSDAPPDGAVAGGWVAYEHYESGTTTQPFSEIRLRAPGFSGAPPAYSERVTPAGGYAELEALAPDGTVAWHTTTPPHSTPARYYISPRNGPVVDAGPKAAAGERVVWRHGGFYLVRQDGSVYALTW